MNPDQMWTWLGLIAPVLLVSLGGCVSMLLSVAEKRDDAVEHQPEAASAYLVTSLAFLALALVALWLQQPAGSAWNGLVSVDRFAIVGQGILVFASGIALSIGGAYWERQRLVRGEYFALSMFATAGMMLMVLACELLTFFVGLEIMSLAIYVLVCFRRADRWSQEAALKYFINGSFASAFFLFGAGLLFGATGATDYVGIAAVVKQAGVLSPLFLSGATLCLIGFAFKVAAVPFHMWAPDAYMGAPTTVTGYMAATVKTAGFLAFLRFTLMALGNGAHSLVPAVIPLIEVLAIVTMTVGNLLALLQRRTKRMLAYSSISHAGYLLVGMVGALERGDNGVRAVMFYLLTYGVTTIGAFGILASLEKGHNRHEDGFVHKLAGIGYLRPGLALALTVFMFGLSGIPPTAGFVGKILLFGPALEAGHSTLVVIALLNSVFAVYYYLRVIVFMYMKGQTADEHGQAQVASPFMNVALAVAAVLTVAVGVAPQDWLQPLAHLLT